MKLIPVQPEDVDDWKERLSWHFDSFCRDGSAEIDALWQDVAVKQRQLWVAERDGEVLAAALTCVVPDRHKTLDLTHGAGRNRKDWQGFWLHLAQWGRDIGCKRFRTLCRPGWERVFRDESLPLKRTHVMLEGWL